MGRHPCFRIAAVMRLLLAAALAFFATPAAAFADATLTMREVPLHGERTLAASAAEFDMGGLHWRGPGSVQFRTRSQAGRGSGWRPADPDGEGLPDFGSAATRANHGCGRVNPYSAGP